MRCLWVLFHDWGRWSEPYAVTVVPIDEIGHRIGPDYLGWRQERRCERCGRFQTRKCRAPRMDRPTRSVVP